MMRQEALSALIRMDSKLKLQKATRARTRSTEELKQGQWVYVHRRNNLGKYWREGPAVVVQVSGSTVWCSLRGNLLKVNAEMVRSATTQELRGIEELTEVMHELRDAEERRGKRQFRDLTAETSSGVISQPSSWSAPPGAGKNTKIF
eukprot:2453213-Amphidinium_carterae.1